MTNYNNYSMIKTTHLIFINQLCRKSLFSVTIQQDSHQILKHYLTNRFKYTTGDYVQTLVKLKNSKVQQKDQRFMNLLLSVERNLGEFQVQAKIKILWTLVNMKINQQLTDKLIKEIQTVLSELSLKQITLYLWCLTKMKTRNVKLVLKIADSIKQILNNTIQWKVVNDETNQNIDLEDLQIQIIPNKQSQKNEINALTCSLIFWCFCKMKMTDKQIFNILLKQLVAKNIQVFTNRMLIIILYSCIQINYDKKRIVSVVYDQIRKNYQDLQNQSVLTLKLLLQSITKLQKIQSKFVIWVAQTIINKHDKVEDMSTKFASQIAWCLLVNNIYDKEAIDFLVKCVINKIDDTNGTDCTMTLLALYKSQKRKSYARQIKILIQRVQGIYNSLNKRSKQIIKQLSNDPQFKSKRLRQLSSQ